MATQIILHCGSWLVDKTGKKVMRESRAGERFNLLSASTDGVLEVETLKQDEVFLVSDQAIEQTLRQ